MGENEEKKGYWWKDGLSVDETKISALIICLVITMCFGFYCYIVDRDVSGNLTLIIQTLITAVAGVNVGSKILDVFQKK